MNPDPNLKAADPEPGLGGCGSGPGSEWFQMFSRGNLDPDTVGFN